MARSNRSLWIGLGLIAVFFLLAMPFGGYMMGHDFGARPYVGSGGPPIWGWGLLGFGLLRILFFGLVLFLALRLFSGFGWGRYRGYRGYPDDRDYPEAHGEDISSPVDLPALEILRRRYAAGEITREQYEEMRKTLEPGTPA